MFLRLLKESYDDKICFLVSVETPDVTCYLLSRGVAGWDPPGPASCQPWWAVLGGHEAWPASTSAGKGKGRQRRWSAQGPERSLAWKRAVPPPHRWAKGSAGGGTCLKPSRPAAGHSSRRDGAVGLSPEMCGQHFRARVSAGTWPQSGSADPTAIS